MITNHSEELKLADNYLKLKNCTALLLTKMENRFLKSVDDGGLTEIIMSEDFKAVKNLIEQIK